MAECPRKSCSRHTGEVCYRAAVYQRRHGPSVGGTLCYIGLSVDGFTYIAFVLESSLGPRTSSGSFVLFNFFVDFCPKKLTACTVAKLAPVL